MTTCRSLVLVLSLCAVPALAQPRVSAPTTAPAAHPLIEAIRAAPDPSSTIEAYVRGVAAGRVSAVEIKRAFVRHMADLGVPELADAQAHDLVGVGAADPTIKGIAAYNAAARGDAHTAINTLTLALIERPDDPFLLRTAGQLVAWYDSEGDQAQLSRNEVTRIAWLRDIGEKRREFVETYLLVAEARQQRQATRPAEATAAAEAEKAATEPVLPRSTTPTLPPTENTSGKWSSATSSDEGTSDDTSDWSRSYSSSGYSYPYGYYYPYYAYGSYEAAGSLITLRDRDFEHAPGNLDHRGIGGEHGRGMTGRDLGGGRGAPPPFKPDGAPTGALPRNHPSAPPRQALPSRGPGGEARPHSPGSPPPRAAPPQRPSHPPRPSAPQRPPMPQRPPRPPMPPRFP